MSRKPWQRDVLDPFGKLYLEMYKRVREMSDTELRGLAKACRWPSQTNCGWHVYRVTPVVAEMADNELRWRAQNAKEKAPTYATERER